MKVRPCGQAPVTKHRRTGVKRPLPGACRQATRANVYLSSWVHTHESSHASLARSAAALRRGAEAPLEEGALAPSSRPGMLGITGDEGAHTPHRLKCALSKTVILHTALHAYLPRSALPGSRRQPGQLVLPCCKSWHMMHLVGMLPFPGA